jgi:hypothetical protein
MFIGAPEITTAVGVDVAEERPAASRAVTFTRMTDPMSAFLTR